MDNIDWILEVVLVGALAITLVHAIRLERALKLLRHDRDALGEAIAGIDQSTRQAEEGIGRLESTAAESARILTLRVEQSLSLKDDLQFLVDRGTNVADRLDALVRAARSVPETAPDLALIASPDPRVRSQAERELLLALRGAQ